MEYEEIFLQLSESWQTDRQRFLLDLGRVIEASSTKICFKSDLSVKRFSCQSSPNKIRNSLIFYCRFLQVQRICELDIKIHNMLLFPQESKMIMLSERKYKHCTFIFKTAYDYTTILLETNFWVAMKYTVKEKVVRHNVFVS